MLLSPSNLEKFIKDIGSKRGPHICTHIVVVVVFFHDTYVD